MSEATFKKADFHIHTPASLCYYDKSVTSEQIVEAALVAELEVIAITDHNTFSSVDAVRKAAEKTGLSVIPGAELSTRGGHYLALFDIDTPLNELNQIIEILQPDKSRWGDGSATLKDSTEEIIEQIALHGGVVIAAHIERWPSGVLESGESGQTKMKILSSPYLSALEITIPQDKVLWNEGKMSSYPRKYACTQSSDAHNINEIGRRPVYLRMDDCRLDSLKSAFLNYSDSIVFPQDME